MPKNINIFFVFFLLFFFFFFFFFIFFFFFFKSGALFLILPVGFPLFVWRRVCHSQMGRRLPVITIYIRFAWCSRVQNKLVLVICRWPWTLTAITSVKGAPSKWHPLKSNYLCAWTIVCFVFFFFFIFFFFLLFFFLFSLLLLLLLLLLTTSLILSGKFGSPYLGTDIAA